MAIVSVGPSQPFKTLAAGVAAAKDGDTVAVDGGSYTNDFPAPIGISLRFQAVGPRVVLIGSGNIPNGKGIIIAGKNDGTMPTISFNGFDFTGATSTSSNGAGIRYQSGFLTCTNCRFVNCQDGILATPWIAKTGSITVDHSEFASCGKGDGQSHNMYIGNIESFTLSNSYSHDCKVGHEVKCRAMNGNISNTRIYDNDGTSSYSIDFPDSGNLTVTNCTIQQGKAGQNAYMFTYGVGSTGNPGRTANFSGCTIVNDRSGVYLVFNKVAGVTVKFTNCKLFGVPNTVQAKGSGSVSLLNPTWLATRPVLDTKPPYQSTFPPVKAGTLEADESAVDLPEPLAEQPPEAAVEDV